MASLKEKWTVGARRLFARLGAVLAGWHITADMLTLSGLALHAIAVPVVVLGHFTSAAIILIVAALCDGLDGAVARAGAGTTTAGAFLDSSTDRVSEMLISGALVIYMALHDRWYEAVAMLILFGAAQMVSYARARAEALGAECRVGFMSRPERVVGLILGFLFAGWTPFGVSFLTFMIYLMVVLTLATAVYRILYVMRQLRAAEQEPSSPE